MTDAEYKKVLGLVATALFTHDYGDSHVLAQQSAAMRRGYHERSRVALDAIGYRELREAADKLVNNERWGTWMYHEGEDIERDAETLRAALTQEQDNADD